MSQRRLSTNSQCLYRRTNNRSWKHTLDYKLLIEFYCKKNYWQVTYRECHKKRSTMKCFKASFLIAATFACFNLGPEKVEYYNMRLSTPEGQGMVLIFRIHDCNIFFWIYNVENLYRWWQGSFGVFENVFQKIRWYWNRVRIFLWNFCLKYNEFKYWNILFSYREHTADDLMQFETRYLFVKNFSILIIFFESPKLYFALTSYPGGLDYAHHHWVDEDNRQNSRQHDMRLSIKANQVLEMFLMVY